MPLYEYRCNDCNGKFDALVRATSPEAVVCGGCQSQNVRRLVSAFATVGGYDDQFVASESAPTRQGGCCGGGCGCGH